VNAHEVYGAWDESARRVPWHLAQRVAAGVLIKTSTAFVVTVRKRQNDLGRLFRLWRNKIRLIPIGPTILPTAPDSEWRTRHEVDEATVIVSTLGLGHPTQDTAQFTQVLDHAVALGVNLHLFVGGRLTIAHPLATNLGFLDAVSAAQLLSASDLFALPLTDGISGRRSSAISALASGAVVVSTAGTDTDQDLFHDSGIMTTPAGDADAFSDAVIRLASDPERRAELGAQSQRFFREHFAWETIADRWDDLLTTSADVTKAKDA
jgi:glycosyltransferase involved in cell wall biosynthesis